jgi:hypothetical protein
VRVTAFTGLHKDVAALCPPHNTHFYFTIQPTQTHNTDNQQTSHDTANMNNNPNAAGGQQDYLDKAFNAGAKKFGGAQGQKIAGNRGMSEKIVRHSPKPLDQLSSACKPVNNADCYVV